MTPPTEEQIKKQQEKSEKCEHYFILSHIADEVNPFRKVGYAICHKCGEIRKQEIIKQEI